MSEKQKNGSSPVIHWMTPEETVARQKAERPRRGTPVHPDPTADAAIGRVYSEEKENEEKINGRKHTKHKNSGNAGIESEQSREP